MTTDPKSEILALAADHGGFQMKNGLAAELTARGYEVVDLGTNGDASVDYPDFAHAASQGILAGTYSRAILVCGTGVGMAIAANRHVGIRAVNCSDTFTARLSREHNASNVLTIGARVVGPGLAWEIVHAWLLASPSDDPRHTRRVSKIER